MSYTKKIALSGIFSALCLLFLFIGSMFQVMDLSAAALGSLVILVAFIELGKAWSFGVYAVASVLSLLLLPQKTAAIVFALFAGFYPIIKVFLNKIKPFWLSYTVRIAIFNIFLTAIIYVAKYLLKIEEDFFIFGWIVYGLCNITFIAYDLAVEKMAIYYIQRIRNRLFKH